MSDYSIGDGFGEVIIGYQSVTDSMYAGTDTAKANPKRTFVRVLEYTGKSTTLDVRDVVLITPDDYKLSQNYPNPFNPVTTIRFGVPQAADVSIVIYNSTGQKVRTLTADKYPAGFHQLQWDGRNDSGEAVASGLYLYMLRTNGFQQVQKMLLLK